MKSEDVQETSLKSAFSWRAVLIGMICVAITCVVVCYAELISGSIQIGYLQLPPAVVGMLVLLLASQALLNRIAPRLRLERHELFTIYIMMLLAAMISSRGLLEKVIPFLNIYNYYETPNQWQGLFDKYIPAWAVPFKPMGKPQQFAVSRWYDGLRPGEHIPWGIWLVPLACWSLFILFLFGAYLCLASILRKQWVDNEKLSFPLVQLPMEAIRGETISHTGVVQPGFLKNPLTWIGFAIPAIVFAMKGLHQWYPSFPDVITDVDIGSYLTAPPYNAIDTTHLFFSFAAIGFFYLLPTDLLFSLWFFFLLTRVLNIYIASLGYQPESMPLYPPKMYIGYQNMGAYVVLVGYMIWSAKPHLQQVWRAAICRKAPGDADDSGELLPYRTSFWGLVICILLAAGWLTVFGMSFWLALFELVVLVFIVGVVLARSTSESGMLMTETTFRPSDMLRMVGNLKGLGGANLTGLAFLDGTMVRDQRGLIMTGFLDSMKLGDGFRVKRRSLIGVMLIGMITAVMVGGYLHLILPYKIGAVNMYSYVYQWNGTWAWNNAKAVIQGNQPSLPWYATINFVIGVVVTLILATLRMRLGWFPLNPLGYALCGTWTMIVFWWACLVGWLIKVLILRYGGMSLYTKARPFFLGMVLGEFTMALFWVIPAILWRTPTPTFPWP